MPIMGLLVHIAMRTPIILDFLCAWIGHAHKNLRMVTTMRKWKMKIKEVYTNRIKEDPDGYERALKTFEKHLNRISKK